MSTQDTFDAIYKASIDPRLAKLIGVPYSDAKRSAATVLAKEGLIIDNPIMVWNWSAYWVMQYRQQLQMRFAPDGLGQFVIKVSTNPVDYPPFTPPAAIPLPNQDPVGPQAMALDDNMYSETVLGTAWPDQASYTDARGTFVHHVVVTPFGRSSWWEKS